MLRRHFLNTLFDNVSNKIYYKTSNAQPYDIQTIFELYQSSGGIIENPLKSNDFVADNLYCATFVKPLYVLGFIEKDSMTIIHPLFIGTFPNVNGENITDIELPNVKFIAPMAFHNCSSLTNITIPNSVTHIGASAFSGCESLTSITFDGTKGQWKKIQLESYWNNLVPATVVHCTDGDVEI